MLKRFEKLVELAKDNDEIKKVLEFSLDELLNSFAIKAFNSMSIDKYELEQAFASLFDKRMIRRLILHKVRLDNDELRFSFKLSGDIVSYKINTKNYKCELLDIDFLGHKDESDENKAQATKNISLKTQELSERNAKIIAHAVINKVQDYQKEQKYELTKSELEKIEFKLGSAMEDVWDLASVSVGDVECEKDSIYNRLNDIDDLLDDILTRHA